MFDMSTLPLAILHWETYNYGLKMAIGAISTFPKTLPEQPRAMRLGRLPDQIGNGETRGAGPCLRETRSSRVVLWA